MAEKGPLTLVEIGGIVYGDDFSGSRDQRYHWLNIIIHDLRHEGVVACTGVKDVVYGRPPKLWVLA